LAILTASGACVELSWS